VVSVLAVDDHAASMRAMRAVVAATSGFELVAEARSGEDALVLAAGGAADLFLVDVHLPGIDGCELTRRLRAVDPAAVVFLVSSDDDPTLHQAPATCGAAAFLPKERLGRRALASAWAQFGHTPNVRLPVAQTVLKTKFGVPPTPTATVVRRRLLDSLDAGVRSPLTLLAAPAGAGKSALLSSWIAAGRAPGPVAWLSLDRDDCDRRRFWRAVLATLSHATGDPRIEALAVSPREPVDLDLVLPALVDALAARDEPVVLVLDDLQEVADVVREDLERLVRYPPPALSLVLVTRADPPIALGRLRLEGWLTEIRAGDLAFTPDEASALFDALGVRVAPAEVATLWERTEGWAAGLSLAAMSLRTHPDRARFIEHFAGTDATVSDYLVSEVLARQAPDLRDFLLRTSIVDRVCGELADALTGGSDGHRMLARLEHGGALLAPLDEHGIWHRYHPLFAELLRAELRAQLGDEVEGLHRRAAAWLAANADHAGALRHAAVGRAWDLAAELVIECWVGRLIDGEMAALRPVLEAMPRRHVDACPELSLAFGAAMLAFGRAELAEPYLRAAEDAETLVAPERRPEFAAAIAAVVLYEGRFGADPAGALEAARGWLARGPGLEGNEVTPNLRGLVLAQLGIVELWTGELDAAVGHLERAHAVATEEASDWTALASTAHLALAGLFRGELARALRRAEETLAIAEHCGWARSEPAAAAYSVLAAVCLLRDEVDEAERLIGQASAALRDTREPALRAVHTLNRAQLLSDRGEDAAALDLLHATREQLAAWPSSAPMWELLSAQEGLLEATTGAPEAGRRLLDHAAREDTSSLAVANALARLDLLDGDAEAARRTLAPHLDRLRSADGAPLPARAEAWLLDALALDFLAEHEAAAHSLERALDLAEPAGLRRIVVSHGSAIGPLLRRHIRRGTAHPAMVGDAVETIERRGRPGPRPSAILAEPLSEREQAILGYLPSLMSNQEIAGTMMISVNTVKTHLKAIYRKLDAPGRREAVQRGRELALIP
jgi:LuxR family maltose regulon positive regulatory protein